MKPGWQVGLDQALTLGGVGLLIGGIGSWVGIAFGNDIPSVTSFTAKAYWVLIVLIPACLAYMTGENLDGENKSYYHDFTSAIIVLMIAGIGGVIASSALFLIPATNIPFIFARMDTMQVRESLYEQIGQLGFWVYLAVTMVTALGTAIWSIQKSK